MYAIWKSKTLQEAQRRDEELDFPALVTKEDYVDVEGLLRKNYIADIEKGFAGGVYTFSTIENAKEWFSEDRIKWITERYSKPEIEYYESPVIVDNEKNKIIS